MSFVVSFGSEILNLQLHWLGRIRGSGSAYYSGTPTVRPSMSTEFVYPLQPASLRIQRRVTRLFVISLYEVDLK